MKKQIMASGIRLSSSRLGLIAFLAVLASALAWPAYAGWVEVNSHSGTTYISDGKLKNVSLGDGEMWSVFDADKGTITMVNPARRSYTEIDPEKFCEQTSFAMEGMMEGLGPEERAMMEQMMGQDGSARRPPVVTVAKMGGGGMVAGYNTVRYSVSVDGRPYKDVWLATDAPIMQDVRKFIKAAMEMSAIMEDCSKGPVALGSAPEASREYLSLMETGWTMKEVNRQSGEVEAEVIKLEKRSIPASEFMAPPGYRRVEMRQMMEGMME